MDTASGAPQAYPSTPGLYHLTTQADGDTVYYTLRIPAGYDGHTALPVILCLHFGGQPTEWYGGRFLHLIPIPGLGSRVALLGALTTAQSAGPRLLGKPRPLRPSPRWSSTSGSIPGVAWSWATAWVAGGLGIWPPSSARTLWR